MNIVDKLHKSAIELAKTYKKTENDLLTVLMEMDAYERTRLRAGSGKASRPVLG